MDSQTRNQGNDGHAYGRPAQSYDAELVEIGPGTPCGVPLNTAPDFGGKRWSEMTDEEHYLPPGDWEAQLRQARITLHEKKFD